jgi:CheY-like chemotaxis protein
MAARPSDFDIALVDIHMPQMDGITLVKRWREIEERGQQVTVVAISADIQYSREQACLEAGMDDFLAKPFTLSQRKEKLFSVCNA